LLGCNLTFPGGTVFNNMAPVTINYPNIPAGDANTDTLLVFYGYGTGSPQGDLVFNTGNYLQTPAMFVANDWVIFTPPARPAPCPLTLDKVSNVVGNVVSLTSGTTNLAVNGRLFNIGQSYRAAGYAVRSGNLTTCDFYVSDCTQVANWAAIANNIVSLRAQYGRDTATGAMDGIVDIYDQTTPSGSNTACAWARISALRLAIVSRSVQYEKTAVTTVAPTWDGSVVNNPAGSAASAIDLSGNSSWQNYRYKVFQTIVPIRNISWMGVAPSC
jgi:type IV pilus assembly protein PilW